MASGMTDEEVEPVERKQSRDSRDLSWKSKDMQNRNAPFGRNTKDDMNGLHQMRQLNITSYGVQVTSMG